METFLIFKLLVQFLSSFSFIGLIFFIMKKMSKLIDKKKIVAKKKKNAISDNNARKEKEREVMMQLPRKEILDYYLIDELFEFISKYGELSSNNFDLYIQYRDISTAGQKNSILYSKEDAEKLKELAQLKKHLKPEYYFRDDFYKLLPEFEQNFPNEFEQFGQYVSLELKCLKFEENKEKLKNEIRKIIVRIAEEDTNSLLKDNSATAQAQNHVVNPYQIETCPIILPITKDAP
ncbi:hypothetical protein M0804_000217 [Polistes exclamans]|nr:hypothetical protein M0804_000217 [Polistes exclamans]